MERRDLPAVTFEPLSQADLATEHLMLGLRLREGVALAGLAGAEAEIERYERLGLLEVDAHAQRLRVTEQGRYLVDGIVTDLLLAIE